MFYVTAKKFLIMKNTQLLGDEMCIISVAILVNVTVEFCILIFFLFAITGDIFQEILIFQSGHY